MRNGEKEKIELTALLDGEVDDADLAEQLAQAIATDPELQAEYNEQREIKSMLGSLPEYEAPDFMATRVLGEIAARKQPRRASLFKTLTAAVGGFAVLAIAFSATSFMLTANNPGDSEDTMVASPGAEMRLASEPMFSPQNWNEFSPSDEITDEGVREFLELANEAHAYRVMVSNTEGMSPNMGEALLVLDTGGSQ